MDLPPSSLLGNEWNAYDDHYTTLREYFDRPSWWDEGRDAINDFFGDNLKADSHDYRLEELLHIFESHTVVGEPPKLTVQPESDHVLPGASEEVALPTDKPRADSEIFEIKNLTESNYVSQSPVALHEDPDPTQSDDDTDSSLFGSNSPITNPSSGIVRSRADKPSTVPPSNDEEYNAAIDSVTRIKALRQPQVIEDSSSILENDVVGSDEEQSTTASAAPTKASFSFPIIDDEEASQKDLQARFHSPALSIDLRLTIPQLSQGSQNAFPSSPTLAHDLSIVSAARDRGSDALNPSGLRFDVNDNQSLVRAATTNDESSLPSGLPTPAAVDSASSQSHTLNGSLDSEQTELSQLAHTDSSEPIGTVRHQPINANLDINLPDNLQSIAGPSSADVIVPNQTQGSIPPLQNSTTPNEVLEGKTIDVINRDVADHANNAPQSPHDPALVGQTDRGEFLPQSYVSDPSSNLHAELADADTATNTPRSFPPNPYSANASWYANQNISSAIEEENTAAIEDVPPSQILETASSDVNQEVTQAINDTEEANADPPGDAVVIPMTSSSGRTQQNYGIPVELWDLPDAPPSPVAPPTSPLSDAEYVGLPTDGLRALCDVILSKVDHDDRFSSHLHPEWRFENENLRRTLATSKVSHLPEPDQDAIGGAEQEVEEDDVPNTISDANEPHGGVTRKREGAMQPISTETESQDQQANQNEVLVSEATLNTGKRKPGRPHPEEPPHGKRRVFTAGDEEIATVSFSEPFGIDSDTALVDSGVSLPASEALELSSKLDHLEQSLEAAEPVPSIGTQGQSTQNASISEVRTEEPTVTDEGKNKQKETPKGKGKAAVSKSKARHEDPTSPDELGLDSPSNPLSLAKPKSLLSLAKPNRTPSKPRTRKSAATPSGITKPATRARKTAVDNRELAGLFNSPPRKAAEKAKVDVGGRLRSESVAPVATPAPASAPDSAPAPGLALAPPTPAALAPSADTASNEAEAKKQRIKFSISEHELKELGEVEETKLRNPKKKVAPTPKKAVATTKKPKPAAVSALNLASRGAGRNKSAAKKTEAAKAVEESNAAEEDKESRVSTRSSLKRRANSVNVDEGPIRASKRLAGEKAPEE